VHVVIDVLSKLRLRVSVNISGGSKKPGLPPQYSCLMQVQWHFPPRNRHLHGRITKPETEIKKMEVAFNEQKIVRYTSFGFIMGQLKRKVHVFTRFWPVWLPCHVPGCRLTLAGLLSFSTLTLGLLTLFGWYIG